jgi:AraC-like DNA-binding protein
MLIRPERWRIRRASGIVQRVSHPNPWTPVDPLGQALYFLRMSGAFTCRSELTAPWGLLMPPFEDCLWFHVVTTGACVLEGSDFERVPLRAGDFALVPHGKGHRLRTAARVPTPDVTELPQNLVSERYSLLRHGGGGAPTTLICGVVRFDHPAAVDLLALLPAVIHLEALRAPDPGWMDATLKLMAAEARALRPGGETVVTRLADVLVIQAIRTWLETDPTARTGWLGALQDPQVGRALSAIVREPARPWTVGSLAQLCAMSRSAFAARFTGLVGESPMQHVTRVRMRFAASALREGTESLAALAGRLGYQSEAAFSRAFKRQVGTPPGVARRAARAAADTSTSG